MIIKAKTWQALTSGERLSALAYMVYLTQRRWAEKRTEGSGLNG